jgi:hypothetical protein
MSSSTSNNIKKTIKNFENFAVREVPYVNFGRGPSWAQEKKKLKIK